LLSKIHHSSLSILHRLFVLSSRGLFLQLLLLSPLLLKQSFLFGSFLLSSFLSSQQILLPFPFVLFQLLRICLVSHEVLFHLLEHLDDSFLGALFDPFPEQIAGLILLVGLDFVDDHIVEIIAENFLDLVATLRVVFGLVFSCIGGCVPKTVRSSSKS
jgi:hypothetical protein